MQEYLILKNQQNIEIIEPLLCKLRHGFIMSSNESKLLAQKIDEIIAENIQLRKNQLELITVKAVEVNSSKIGKIE